MIKADSVEQGVKTLLDKNLKNISGWRLVRKADSAFTDTLITADGGSTPLLWWRYNKKSTSVYNVSQNRLGDLCSVKSYAFEPATERLEDVLYREIDLAQWWLRSKAKYFMGFEAANACGNYCIKMENGTVANLEIACTMPEEAQPQYKRTVFGTEGMASDMVVDNMIIQHNVHLFNDGANPKVFNDTESWMYGLSQEDTERAYCAARLLMGKEDGQEYLSADSFLKRAVNCARMSAARGARVYMEEAE